jgi:2-methylcitrate dehydratase PrpD
MSERIARVLSARLEELAHVAERSGAAAPAVARLLEAASVATMHAVALDLLTAAQAKAIWHDAAERHPVLDAAEPLDLRDAA